MCQNNNYVSLSIGKTTSEYRYFAKYNGIFHLGLSGEHYLNKNFFINMNSNFGNLKNKYNTKAWFVNVSIGGGYELTIIKRLNLSYNFGIGYEKLNIIPYTTNKITLNGITFINALSLKYKIKGGMNLILGYKVQQSDMNKNDAFSALNYFHRTRFGALTLGIGFNLKQNKDEKE